MILKSFLESIHVYFHSVYLFGTSLYFNCHVLKHPETMNSISQLCCKVCLKLQIRKHSNRVLLFGHYAGHLALFGIKMHSVKVLLCSQCLVRLS